MKIDTIVLFLISRNSDVGISIEIISPSTLSRVTKEATRDVEEGEQTKPCHYLFILVDNVAPTSEDSLWVSASFCHWALCWPVSTAWNTERISLTFAEKALGSYVCLITPSKNKFPVLQFFFLVLSKGSNAKECFQCFGKRKQTNKHGFLFGLVSCAGNIFLWKYSFVFIFPFIKPFAVSEKQSDGQAHQQLKENICSYDFCINSIIYKDLIRRKTTTTTT